MNNFVGTLISLITFGIVYGISKLEMYKEISSNPIFVGFMIFFFAVIGYFISKFINEAGNITKKTKRKDKKGKDKDIFMPQTGGFNENK